MMNLLWFGILVFSTVVCGWQHHNQQGIDRRSVVGILGGIFAPNVVQAATCVSGVGEGCQDLSEGNSYIQSLQLKSAERKAQYEKENVRAYQMKNYPDFFASLNPPKFLVQQPDGTFGVYTEEDLVPLKKAGRIRVQQPKTMGGKVTDLTQKPIMVLLPE